MKHIKNHIKTVFLLGLPVIFFTLPSFASANMQVLSHWDFGPTFDVVVNGNYWLYQLKS